MKNFLTMAGLALVMPVLAEAHPLEIMSKSIGVDAISLERGSAGNVTWENAIKQENGAVFFSEMVVTTEKRVASYRRVELSDAGIRAEVAKIEGREGGKMETGIGINRLTLSGPDSFDSFFGNSSYCLAFSGDADDSGEDEVDVETPGKGVLEFAGLTMTTPPSPQTGGRRSIHGPEKVSASSGSVSFQRGEDDSCISPDGVDLHGLLIVSAAGDSGSIARVSYEMQGPLAHEVKLTGVSATDPDGKTVIQMAAAGFDIDLSEGFIEAAKGGILDFSKSFDALTSEAVSLGFDLVGLQVADGLIKEDGVALPAFRGGMSGRIESDGSLIGLSHEASFTGLYSTLMDVRLAVSKSAGGASSLLSAIRGGDKRVEILGRLSLVSAEFGYRDDGIRELTEEATGSNPSDAVRFAERFADKLPAVLRDPVFSWLADTVDTEGHVVIAPENPVGMTEIGMMAVMNPDALAGKLGMSVSDTWER